jgi:regulator of sigma D
MLSNMVSAVTLGTIKPDRPGIVGPGLFGGGKHTSQYLQDYVSAPTLGLFDQRNRQAAGNAKTALEAESQAKLNATQQSAMDAANAVQSSAAEARRQRASKRQSSVLSNFQGASQVGVSPATLQPAQPRRSVLG